MGMRAQYIQRALQANKPRPETSFEEMGKRPPLSIGEMSALASALSGMSAGAGTYGGVTPSSRGLETGLNRLQAAEKDKQARLLSDIRIAGLADEQARLDKPLDPITRALLKQRIAELPIGQTELMDLPEEMTLRQVQDNPVLSSLAKNIVPKQPSVRDEIARNQELMRRKRRQQPLNEIDRQFLQKKLTEAGIKQVIPPDYTYGDAEGNIFFGQFMDKMKGYGIDQLKQSQFELQQEIQRGRLDLQRERLEAQKEQARTRREMTRQRQDEEREQRLKKQARPSEKFAEQMTKYDVTLDLLKDIKRRKPQFDTGRLSATTNRAGAFFGIDDPEYSAFRADVDDQLAKYIKEISGAAASDRERAFLSGIQISTNDNDTTFMRKLESAINKLQQARRAAIEAQKRLGKDVESFTTPLVEPKESFPRKVRKGDQEATVTNEQELKEAQAEGWK